MPDKSLYENFNTLFNCYMSECDGVDCERCKFNVKDPIGVMLSALAFISNSVWIPVTEKEPECAAYYLVTVEGRSGYRATGIAFYGESAGWYGITPWNGEVVAWSILPESWGGEEQCSEEQ